jgi:LysM repeat protein
MTVTGEPTRQPPPDGGAVTPRASRRRDAAAAHEVCPFLATEDATWRSAYAAREHRCRAVRPAAQLTISKQRELCLLAEHQGCATYLAARAVEAERRSPSPGDDGAALWTPPALAPVVLEPARRMGALAGGTARGGGQALLAGLMALAFLMLVIARTQSPAAIAGPSPVPSEAPTFAAGSASPVPAPTREAATGEAASPAASPSPTSAPTPTTTPAPAATPRATPDPTAAATRTYRVKAGDTLSAIAARYGTTVRKLAALNAITDPRALRIGQVLQIP